MDGGLWYSIGGSDQDHPQKKEIQNGKKVAWGGLTKQLRKEEKLKTKERKNDVPIWMQSPNNRKER